MQFRDLPPKNDPKGGEPPRSSRPKTPYPGQRVPQEGDTDYVWYPPHPNGSAAAWRSISFGLLGLLCGVGVAYLTALRERGISRPELDQAIDQVRKDGMEYTKNYSPFNMAKTGIDEHQRVQDENIGALKEGDRALNDRVNKLENSLLLKK